MYKALQTKSLEDKAMLAILHPDRKKVSEYFIEKKKEKKETSKSKEIAEEKPKIDQEEVKPIAPVEKKIEKKETAEPIQVQDQEDPMLILQQRLAELNKETSPLKESIKVEGDEDTLFEPEPSVSLDELVEKFNKFPPSVSSNFEDFEEGKEYKDMGKSSLQEKMNIVSETLAELYTSQGAYDKAIKIYEALMVKHPKKNATFAKLIESLKEKKKS
jgi:hypothetical protein